MLMSKNYIFKIRSSFPTFRSTEGNAYCEYWMKALLLLVLVQHARNPIHTSKLESVIFILVNRETNNTYPLPIFNTN